MTVIPDDAHPRYVRALVAAVGLIGAGYVAELAGREAVPALRAVGVVLALVGMGVFLVAGVGYLARYLTDMLGRFFG